jgi:hypothetical protein
LEITAFFIKSFIFPLQNGERISGQSNSLDFSRLFYF